MKRRSVSLLLAALVGAIAIGCVSSPPFTKEGIPQSKYLVGGGLEINYQAPSDGTVYWVEETSAKVLTTRSLNAGEAFEIEGDLDLEALATTLGIALPDSRFTLYFVPISMPK